MEDTIAQTKFENVSKQSNDSLLIRGNTFSSDEDRLKLNELMELYTKLQSRVLDLEKTKATQALEITSLKRRVKKLEKKQRSRTHKLKRLYKVGLTTRVDSSKDEQSLGEDASKQGRKINDIDADEDITLVNDQDDEQMFDVNDLQCEDVFIEKEVVDKEVNDVGEVNVVSIATTDSAAATITTKEITLAQALQKVDDDKETTELKQLMEIILNEEEVAIDVIPLVIKSSRIVDLKIYKEGKKSYYQIIRADGKSKMYIVFSKMLESFDREVFEDLYKIIDTTKAQQKAFDDGLVVPVDLLSSGNATDLGHSRDNIYLTDVSVDYLHQPWRAFATSINKCLSGKETGMDKIRLSRTQILWGNVGIQSLQTYYTFASGEKTPKPKYVGKKADSDTLPKHKPVQATKDTRIKPKAKNKIQFHISQASDSSNGIDFESRVPDEQPIKTSGADEGTGTILGFSMYPYMNLKVRKSLEVIVKKKMKMKMMKMIQKIKVI
nr:hypothetical protein [Tanacetum cinerariifolium]